jgi:hypothetical protein
VTGDSSLFVDFQRGAQAVAHLSHCHRTKPTNLAMDKIPLGPQIHAVSLRVIAATIVLFNRALLRSF